MKKMFYGLEDLKENTSKKERPANYETHYYPCWMSWNGSQWDFCDSPTDELKKSLRRLEKTLDSFNKL